MSERHDISTAPRDGTRVDMWFKWWRADTDTFLVKRVPDCYWRTDHTANPQWSTDWGGIPVNSRPVCWMAVPDDPVVTPCSP